MTVSMLNVLSFFFILRLANDSEDAHSSFDAQCSELFLYFITFHSIIMTTRFRCSTFWAFSLSKCSYSVFFGRVIRFRCSMFWAFSLYYLHIIINNSFFMFRCSTFWAFSLFTKSTSIMSGSIGRFRCSTFWAFSL